MTVLFVLAALTCVASIVAGLLVPGGRPVAVSATAALIFLLGLAFWWAATGRGAAASVAPVAPVLLLPA